ncbi:MAG: TauD/TfdA family dioxygenase [Rhodospirillaceae bacterium]
MGKDSTGITVKRMAGALGAEITGIDLAMSNFDNVFPAIHQAFLDHAVVVVRAQNLSPERLVAFSKNFGKPETHVLETFTMKDNPEVLLISNVKEKGKPIGAIYAGQYWHSDLSYMKHPTQASLLHAVELPSYGGDTMFCSMTAAYDQLSEPMKAFLEGLTATHDYTNAYDTFFKHLPDRPPLSETEKAKVPPVIHPVVRTHPDTGNKALFVNPGFTRHINELTPAESRALLDYLFRHCQQAHLIYRHIWAPGDLLIWDNRCTSHLAVADYDMNEHRHLIRTSIEGDVPTLAGAKH